MLVGISLIKGLKEESKVRELFHHFFNMVVNEVMQAVDSTVVLGLPHSLYELYFVSIYVGSVQRFVDAEDRHEKHQAFNEYIGSHVGTLLVDQLRLQVD